MFSYSTFIQETIPKWFLFFLLLLGFGFISPVVKYFVSNITWIYSAFLLYIEQCKRYICVEEILEILRHPDKAYTLKSYYNLISKFTSPILISNHSSHTSYILIIKCFFIIDCLILFKLCLFIKVLWHFHP